MDTYKQGIIFKTYIVLKAYTLIPHDTRFKWTHLKLRDENYL